MGGLSDGHQRRPRAPAGAGRPGVPSSDHSVGLEIGTICRINDVGFSELERFAALVAAFEREECAKVCEYRAMALDYSGNQYVRDHAALDCARSIRARGGDMNTEQERAVGVGLGDLL